MKRYNVSILPSAYNDLKQTRDWYRQHNHDLPKQLTQQVNLSIECIRTAPFAYAIRYKDIHIANINVFPYAIHYFIIENTSTVIVIAIHHTAISPDKWKHRI
jgi:hypothetical protein